MGLLGRDAELARIGAVLANVQSSQVAHAVRIAGAPGVGKTAVLTQAEEPARAGGWLVTRIDAHRIQESLPLVAGRRLADSLIAALGDEAPRYASGLPLTGPQRETDPAAFREAVVRLVEGVLHDYPLLIAVDDAQWIDPESRGLIEDLLRSFGDRAVALLASERTGERAAFGAIAETLALGPVPHDAAVALVQEHYPDAPPAVVEGILQHAKGLPLDIVALAQSAHELRVTDVEGVHASIRAAVAGQLQFLDGPLREFLQICSLIAEPLDYATLVRLWPEDVLNAHMAAASGKYLIQDGTGLRFVHSAIAESVRLTMPVEIPFRRRIISALTAVDAPSLEEHERIVQQALACGDAMLAHKHLLLLAQHATRESALYTASNAYERAFSIAMPPAHDLVATYLEYASVLNMQGRLAEAGSVLQRALADTTSYGITQNAGAVAALYLIAQWGSKGYAAALQSAEPLLRRFKTGDDRNQLLSVVAWLHACADDPVQFEAAKNELTAHAELSHELLMRLHVAQAHLAIHRGEGAAATAAVDAAVAEAGSVLTANRRSAEVSRTLVHFLRFGPRDVESTMPSLHVQKAADRTQVPVVEYLRATVALARGQLADARDILHESLSRPGDRNSRLRLLGAHAAIATLTGQPSDYDAEIAEIASGFSGAPSEQIALPIAAFGALVLSPAEQSEARSLLAAALESMRVPAEINTFNSPFALALAAARLRDRDALERMCAWNGLWTDRAPWSTAHRALARGIAGEALAKTDAATHLHEARTMFQAMDAPLFAMLARAADQRGDAEADAYLAGAGVDPAILRHQKRAEGEPSASRRKGTAVPSRRELEIIALVAEGQTNRQIAQALFLSERTVEGHIANVFNKLGVSSRTQIAAWFLTARA